MVGSSLIRVNSNGEFDYTLPFFHADHVVVEEVHIEAGLKSATQNLSPAVEVIHEISVDPISSDES